MRSLRAMITDFQFTSEQMEKNKTASRFASVTEEQILWADYSACVVYTKTSVGESGGHLPSSEAILKSTVP